MSRIHRILRTAALVPAAGLALFTVGVGTVAGGVGGWAAVVGQVGVLVAAGLGVWGWGRKAEELGREKDGREGWVGRHGRALAAGALWLMVAASMAASPVPRAGRVAVLLLPAWLMVPGAVAWAWRKEGARRWGLRGVALVVGVTSAWALAALATGGSERTAAPIGHHSLLAVWLLALLPLAAVAGKGGAGGWRAVAWAATSLGAVALVATGSLAGQAGLAVEAGLWALWYGRTVRRQHEPSEGSDPRRFLHRPRWVRLAPIPLLLLLLAVFAAPRLAGLVAGRDPSIAARGVYARAGWTGFLERPLLGWGPGATPWTIGLHLEPVPGVNPPGEIVGELHALPLALVYELGALGTLAAAVLIALFVRRCCRGLAHAADPGLVAAGLVGLAGAAVGLLGTAWLAVTALPAALAVAAGAALAGRAGIAGHTIQERGAPSSPTAGADLHARVLFRGTLLLYLILAAVLLLPLDSAHLAYDRALAAEGDAVAEERWLEAAVAADPAFPLYRARLGWWRAATAEGAGIAAAAEEARRAAEEAPGVAALRLAAGVFGAEAGAPWAAATLDRACDLDPLSGRAPFYRAALAPDDPAAAGRAARALLAEPGLGAATWWTGHRVLLADAAERVRAWPGVDAGLRRDLSRALAFETGAALPTAEPIFQYLVIDATPEDSLALRAFRRRWQEVRIAPVELDPVAAARLALPSAAVLPTTSPDAFAAPGCDSPVTKTGS